MLKKYFIITILFLFVGCQNIKINNIKDENNQDTINQLSNEDLEVNNNAKLSEFEPYESKLVTELGYKIYLFKDDYKNHLKIYNKDKRIEPVQIIDLDEYDIYAYNIYLQDVNMDGYEDIVINSGGTLNIRHELFLFDEKKLIFDKVLLEGSAILSYFEPRDNYIMSWLKESASKVTIQEFFWEGNTLVLKSENFFDLEMTKQLDDTYLKGNDGYYEIETKLDDFNIRMYSVPIEMEIGTYTNVAYITIDNNVSMYELNKDINFLINNLQIERLKDSYLVGISGEKEGKPIIATYVVDTESITPLNINDLFMRNDNNFVINNNTITFDSLNIDKGPLGILFRVDDDKEHLYSLVSNFDLIGSEKKIYIIDKDSELYQLNKYYRDYYSHYYGDEIIFFYENPEDFDEEIANILTENLDKIYKKPWKAPLPDNYMINTIISGYLNDDEIIDYAIVVDRSPFFTHKDRLLYVLLSIEQNNYNVLIDANSIIMGSEYGGSFGDPFTGITIEDKNLLVNHYGGSSDRWSYINTYRYLYDELVLVTKENINYSTHSASGTKVILKYLDKKYEKLTYDDGEYNNLLLDEGELNNEIIIVFNKKNLNDFQDNILEELKYMPSLYRVPYGQKYWEGDLEITPIDALNKAKEYLKVDFIKSPLPVSAEIFINYDKLLAYDIPDYYLSREDVILWYLGVSLNENKVHLIRKLNVSTNEYSYIKVFMENGKLLVEESDY